ncbi:hypothetical protein QFC21_007074 [Naganishia friedmannii]|uniref:Uncharacterized protein n=1 Tax=Naganishia friedmannii TaxID=89922 RepID=A0ACC2UZ28_9TREE|nr:hypothetical protein QFC21_007074 [Naganishia friedmannii]
MQEVLPSRPPNSTPVKIGRELSIAQPAVSNRLQEEARRETAKDSSRVQYDPEVQSAPEPEGDPAADGDGCLDIQWRQLSDLLSRMGSPGEGEFCQWKIVFGDADAFADIVVAKVSARVISVEIWEATGHKWILGDTALSKGSPKTTSLRYHCAPYIAYEKRQVDEEQRKRIRIVRPRWGCKGHLSVRIDRRNLSRVITGYGHEMDPDGFTDISIPQDALDYIATRTERTPTELHTELRKKYAEEEKPAHFAQKQVHARWTRENERVWKLHTDELASAALVLEKYASKDIEKLKLPTIRGVQAFAFALKDVLHTCTKEDRSLMRLAWIPPISERRTLALRFC